MPYIVTTRREGRQPGRDHDAAWSRVAVGTLEEAARRIAPTLEELANWPRFAPPISTRCDLAILTYATTQRVLEIWIGASGGTVGPLPGGSLIEVEPVRTFGDLWERLPAGKRLTIDSLDRVDILAAFNDANRVPS